jgi:nitrite reductase/ring-hydroxylating ferredoxin subunit
MVGEVVVDAPAEGQVVEVSVGGEPVVIGRCGGRLFALDGYCPHAGGMLTEGTLDGSKLRCPLHDWGFDVHTGACDAVPSLAVPVVPIREQDGRVVVGPVAGAAALR